MSTPPREESSLNIYHVVYRGVNKQRIFEDEDDYARFAKTLYKYQSPCQYKVLAYCLMSNHVHILIHTGEMSLDRIFQHIIPSFVYWYNKKYSRIGVLFQSRFRSKPVNTSSQFLTVVRYIHLNPVKAAICNRPEEYKYSSFKYYFDDKLIDSSFMDATVTRDFFTSFHYDENDDHCLDIDDEKPRLNDERAMKILKRLSGCDNLTEFQKLDADIRDDVLYDLWMAGISIKQANRVTGISLGVIRKVIAQALENNGRPKNTATPEVPAPATTATPEVGTSPSAPSPTAPTSPPTV